jgi:hypothetical protein
MNPGNHFQFTFGVGLGLPQPDERPTDGGHGSIANNLNPLSEHGVPLSRLLTSSPELYPIAIDPGADAVQFIRLTEPQYAAASFLDARLRAPTPGAWISWHEVRAAAAGLPERCHFIFHISHVGSTLLSRLLGHHPALFSLREPAVLRNLADIHLSLDRADCPWTRARFDDRLSVFLALWSRTFAPAQTALIKATSFVAETSSHLMGRVANSRSVFMYVPPATFLKSLLGGAMSDITTAAGKRLYRLHRRLGAVQWRPQDLSAGELVAMSWLSEMSALCVTARTFPDRVLWVNFDNFLGDPESGLAAALRHFGAGDADEVVKGILSGPSMSRYAKAPEQSFDANVREKLLRRSEGQHAAEIRKGMDWLDRAAANPAVKDVLEAAGRTGQTKS